MKGEKGFYSRNSMFASPILVSVPSACYHFFNKGYIADILYHFIWYYLKIYFWVWKKRCHLQQTLYVRFYTNHGSSFRIFLFINIIYISYILCQIIICSLRSVLVGMKTKEGFITYMICQISHSSWQFLQQIIIDQQRVCSRYSM